MGDLLNRSSWCVRAVKRFSFVFGWYGRAFFRFFFFFHLFVLNCSAFIILSFFWGGDRKKNNVSKHFYSHVELLAAGGTGGGWKGYGQMTGGRCLGACEQIIIIMSAEISSLEGTQITRNIVG